MAFTEIDQVIRQLCRETGEPDFKNYDTILSHVRGALVDLNLFVMPNVKTVYVTVNNLKNINWPDDCIRPIKVQLERNGHKCCLSMYHESRSIEDCGCNDAIEVATKVDDCLCGKSDYNGGFDSAGVAGYDRERRIIHLGYQAQKGDKFLLTYSADGVMDGVSVIPIELETPIGEWVFWKYYRRTSVGISDRARENYKQESYRAKKLYQERGLNEWIDAILKD